MASTSPQQGTYIAFDFGLKYIGCAVGQNITRTARGLTTLNATNGKPKWHQIKALVKTHQPVGFVVGLPLNMDGSESNMSHLARHFAQQLSTKTGVPAELVDERLTTKIAQDELQQTASSRRGQSTHEIAARDILESWFNES